MLEFAAFAILTGLAGASAKQIKHTLTPKKGNAKPVSDFKRRKAASRGKKAPSKGKKAKK